MTTVAAPSEGPVHREVAPLYKGSQERFLGEHSFLVRIIHILCNPANVLLRNRLMQTAS